MTKITNPIKIWMRAASTQEQDQMAELAGTTRAMLYQYAGGFRETSSERAVQIENATLQMSKINPRLPKLYRTDLSSACAQCHFARKCLGAKAEFNLS